MTETNGKSRRADYQREYMRKWRARRAKQARNDAISETKTTADKKNPVGRPSTYDAEIAEKLCALIAGGAGIRAACAKSGISTSMLYDWRRLHPEFDAALQCATRHKVDLWSDDLVDIADRANDDEHDPDRMIRVRQWLMSKHLPTKYGAIAASPPPPAEVRAIEDARVINAKPDENRFAEAERAFRRALLEPPKTREQIVEDTKRQIAELDARAARRR